jgi:hypothetical protein
VKINGATLNGSATLAANTWYRMAVAQVISSTTSYTINIFITTTDSVIVGTADVSATFSSMGSTALLNTGGVRTYLVSNLLAGGASGISVFYTPAYFDNGTTLDDCGDIRVTAKLPATNGNQNNFDTAVGANPANRYLNVNERPLSTTNGWEQAGSSQVNEVYGIDLPKDGDINIAANTIIARTAWMWAAAGTAGLGTPYLLDNAAGFAVTLTITPALYVNITTSNVYPPGNTVIGMASVGAATTTFLYECGVLFAFDNNAIPPGEGIV